MLTAGTDFNFICTVTIDNNFLFTAGIDNTFMFSVGIYSTCMFSAGIDNEFMFTGRLDNLGMSYCSLAALLDCYPTEEHLADETAIKAIALFDHEEVGSASAQGV